MKKLPLILCTLLLITNSAGCGPNSQPPAITGKGMDAAYMATPIPSSSAPKPAILTEKPAPTPDPTTMRATAIEARIAGMTLEEKAASLFWVHPEQLDGTALTFTETTARALDEIPVSGVTLFGDNIKEEAQVRALTGAFRAAGGPGFVVAVDEEGGRVSRLGGLPGFPETPAMDELRDGQAVYDALFAVGAHLKEWGFDLDFAPVCDVLTHPDNTLIGDRAFGRDAGTVSALVPEAVRGLLDAGIQPCLKHFPGHGGTEGDSHTDAVSLFQDLDGLRAVEWPPFTAGIAAGARLVMVGHIALPAVTGDDTPGSLSAPIVTGFLRGELGFDGLVVTDSMRMEAVTSRWDAGEAAVRALLAGCDVILMPEDLRAARDGVINAVRSGRLTEARVDQAIRRRLEIFWAREE